GRGDGTFSGVRIFVGPGAGQAVVGDLNGDQKLDVVLLGVASFLDDMVYLGDGTGGFAAAGTVGTGPDNAGTPALADLDGDGNVRLYIALPVDDGVNVLLLGP